MGLFYLASGQMLLWFMWRVDQTDGCSAVITFVADKLRLEESIYEIL
jgi:hypothetical protein